MSSDHLLGCAGADHSPADEFEEISEYGFPSSLSFVSALPPNIEELNLGSTDTAVVPLLFELLAHIHNFPFLKKLDVGWEKMVYSDKTFPREPSAHNGFTTEEALKFLDLCEAAGVEVQMKLLEPL
jgi:hypothetical protein